jgi:DNA-binding XRE family transcriptional regulator
MLSYWERGLLHPSAEQKEKIASVLGLSVKDIFPEEK